MGETLEDGIINPYTVRFVCKNGTEINCKDKFTATAINNIQIILRPERNNILGMFWIIRYAQKFFDNNNYDGNLNVYMHKELEK